MVPGDPAATSAADRGPGMAPGAGPWWGFWSPTLWGTVALLGWCVVMPIVFAAILTTVGALRRLLRDAGAPSWGNVAVGATLTTLSLGPYAAGAYVAVDFGRSIAGDVQPASYAFLKARKKHRTHLTRHGAAPQTPHGKVPAAMRSVTYPSAGRDLAAWVAFPPGTGKVPVVVYLHGGFALEPGDAGDVYPFLDAGYGVFLPTYRGENGNGGDHELFYGEVDDAVNAVKFIARHRRVLPRRVYLLGHSAGGNLAALVALHDQLPLKLTASVDGLYTPAGLLSFDLPFNPLYRRERDLRTPARFLHQLAVPHRVYVADAGWMGPRIKQYDTIRKVAPRAHFETVPGDHAEALAPAVLDFIEATAEEKDCDDRRIARQLQSPDEAAQKAAMGALRSITLPLSRRQQEALVQLGLKLGRDRGGTPIPAARRGAALFVAVLPRASGPVLERVERAYPTLVPDARTAALEGFVARNTIAALGRALRLIERETDTAVQLPRAELRQVRLDLLYPRLFQLPPAHPLAVEVHRLVLDQCDDLMKAKAPRPKGERQMLARLALARKAMTANDRASVDEAAYEVGVIHDALGCLPDPSPARLRALRRGLTSSRPVPAFFALQGLVALGEAPDRGAVERLAADPRTRALVYRLLQRERQLALFPRRHATQGALASAHVVKWLMHPQELGEAPTEIELARKVPRPAGDYYVFRFRSPRLKHPKRWTVAVAGPYDPTRLSGEAPGDVFSTFDFHRPGKDEAHVDAVMALLEKHRASEDAPP